MALREKDLEAKMLRERLFEVSNQKISMPLPMHQPVGLMNPSHFAHPAHPIAPFMVGHG